MAAGKEQILSILLIDSDESRQALFKKQFSEDLEHKTSLDLAGTVRDALKKIHENSYHVILGDSHFPEGEDVMDVLTELNRTKAKVPFILMVKRGEEARAHRALKSGAGD